MKKKLEYTGLAILILFSAVLSLKVIEQQRIKPIIYQEYSEDTVFVSFPYSFSFETKEIITKEPTVELIDPMEYPDGYGWLIHKISDGSPEVEYTTYRTTYTTDDQALSTIYVPNSLEIKEVEPILYSYGSSIEIGAYFNSKLATLYGTNCDGCYVNESGIGGTSAGIMMGLNSVRQSDGSWKEGLTYDGYYIIATDKAIPLCTIVEISDHRFSGSGLESGVPFKAIVLDRGGAINGSDIDLFAGDERGFHIRNGKRSGMKVEIIGFGSRGRNGLGERVCRANG